jgi:hypothetical protein
MAATATIGCVKVISCKDRGAAASALHTAVVLVGNLGAGASINT